LDLILRKPCYAAIELPRLAALSGYLASKMIQACFFAITKR